MWFEVAVSYDKMQLNGQVKKTTEKYLFDSLSFTESESRAIEELTQFISGDFTLKTNKRTRIAEIFNMGADKFYLAKVVFIAVDEKSGIEKRTITEILVGADDFDEALQVFKDGMKCSMADYELVSLAESPILEVFPAKICDSGK